MKKLRRISIIVSTVNGNQKIVYVDKFDRAYPLDVTRYIIDGKTVDIPN